MSLPFGKPDAGSHTLRLVTWDTDMKPLIIATTALTTICLAAPALSANSEHTRQLLATKECQL